jgi:hypothetical protein
MARNTPAPAVEAVNSLRRPGYFCVFSPVLGGNIEDSFFGVMDISPKQAILNYWLKLVTFDARNEPFVFNSYRS